MKILRISIVVIAYLFTHSLASAQNAPMEVPKKTDPNLVVYRQKIDSLDKQLIALLGQRERVVKDIGIYKAKNNIPPLQVDRFKQVLANTITAGAKEGLSETFITELMNAVHKESLRIEEELKGH